jgi:hypothetical protein
VTVRTPAGAEAVATYYRQILKTGGWKLVNDAKDKDGATASPNRRGRRCGSGFSRPRTDTAP